MEELYNIPSSWEWTKLDDIFIIERGGSPRPIKSFLTDAEDGINWIKIGDVKKGQKYIEDTQEKIKPEGLKKSRLVIEGDFILSNSMSFGRPYIVKKQGAIHDGWLVFRDVADLCNKDFFYYLLSSTYVYQQFSSNASGSTVKNLNIDIVKQTNISLPPLNEQKRIVQKIEKLFSNLDNSDKYLDHLQKQLKRYRQSVLKSAFEGELTKGWRESQSDLESVDKLLEKIKAERLSYIEEEIRKKYQDKTEKWIKDKTKKEVEKFYNEIKSIDEESEYIPNCWKKTRLNLFTNIIMGQSPSSSTYNEDAIGLPFFQGSADFTELNPIIRVWCSEPKKVVETNYILFSVRAPVGAINISNCTSCIGRGLAGIKGFGNISNKFLFFILKNSIENIGVKGKGTTFDSIRADELKNLLINLAPLEEQIQIVKEIEKHFSIIDKLEKVVTDSIKESKRLRQSILKQAFEGKLVVQDSSDESAKLLLQKIAKAKDEYIKQMKKRKTKS